MQNQEISSRTVSDRTVLAGIPGFLGRPREVEELLIWTFHDQMAHSGGATDDAFTGYGAMGYSASCLDDHGGGGGGLVPLRPVVSRLADAVAACVAAGGEDGDYDRLVVQAARASRPDMGTAPVWFEPPNENDMMDDGRRRPKDMVHGGVRWDPKQRMRINKRRVVGCWIERRGPSPEVQAKTRAAYRAWHAALWRAYDSLKAAGFAVLPPVAPALPLEPWECWTPRYADVSDRVAYSPQKQA